MNNLDSAFEEVGETFFRYCESRIAELERELEAERAESQLLRQSLSDAEERGNALESELEDALLKLAIWAGCVTDVYWPKHDGTREWCSELSTYLRGAVHFVGVLEEGEAERLGLKKEE